MLKARDPTFVILDLRLRGDRLHGCSEGFSDGFLGLLDVCF